MTGRACQSDWNSLHLQRKKTSFAPINVFGELLKGILLANIFQKSNKAELFKYMY